MAKKKPTKGGRPAQRSEPTTHQLRQEYYRRRAEQQALEELGLIEPDREPPRGDALWWADTRDALDRLELMHAVWRWAGVTGRIPEPDDWDPDAGWPTQTEVLQVFASWEELIEKSGIDGALVTVAVDRVLTAHRDLLKRREDQETTERRLEEEARKTPELKRQADVARAKREEADARARDAEAQREQLVRERDALSARVEALESEMAELRAPVRAAAAQAAGAAEADRLRVELGQARAHADELAREVDRLGVQGEQDARTIAELTRTLASLDAAGEESADGVVVEAEEEPPGSVLEAVERAASRARHLRFAPRAFETAEASPFRRPGLVFKTLTALDEVAARFAEGDMGRSLGQVAAEHGITQWKPDVAETTRKRYEDDYSFPYEGRKLWVGPHIGLGSGSGAGFVARIYLHVADGGEDGLERGITVAVVGRHLPDTTT